MPFENILDKMSLEEKIDLCSGADYWNTKAFTAYGIPSIRVNDGPHGLRIQKDAADNFGINESIPSTCFPAACATGSSWDRELLKEMGEALAEEAVSEGTAVLLGPGVNIKRNPLCGRNFEYFSEDPYLSGELGAAWISGIQGKGAGASLKHFAGNNQENHRLCSDSIVDERALREIYLTAFEKAVKQSPPRTVMCAYNLLNGTYCSDSKYLLTDILRSEWGYEGAVISDWGAMNNRADAFIAGLDLEMPGSKGYFKKSVLESIKSGRLTEEQINKSAERMLSLVFTSNENIKAGFKYNIEEHHQLARKIAANSAVLLKNENDILPLHNSEKVALIGDMAEKFRYQGSGSSKITPHKVSNILEGFDEAHICYEYYKGYTRSTTADSMLVEEAVCGARCCEKAIIVAGLTEDFESEGFDRKTMDIPQNQVELIREIAGVNKNTVVILLGGAPVTMPWIDNVKAVLNMYLPGQAGGLAAADILTGRVNPSGKLAETYPRSYEDVISSDTYGINPKQVLYKESIYVGYRYYDKSNKAVLFPFGHGLSYTKFEYSDLFISGNEGKEINISLKVKNTGGMEGAEAVQLYIGKPETDTFCPEKELVDFAKINLKPGQEEKITFKLNRRAFSYYNTGIKDWAVQKGKYSVMVGASSRDIRLKGVISYENEAYIESNKNSGGSILSWYYMPQGRPSQTAFETLLGRKIEPLKKAEKGSYDLSCTLNDMMESRFIRLAYKVVEIIMRIQSVGKDYSNPNFKMMMESVVSVPLKNLILMGGGILSPAMAKGILLIANGKILSRLGIILKKREKTQ